MKQMIWMMVTTDKYELPMAVADSAGELARKCGCTENNIYSTVCHYEHGKLKTAKFRRVEVDLDEND
ncbi:MAG: hypothetical protein IIZ78_04095 [Clostridiales bacterium]|nr:hypothetical protein [Clostridiales bacterium]